eukprot:14120736-Heterocapsa_arctica.AAC.1
MHQRCCSGGYAGSSSTCAALGPDEWRHGASLRTGLTVVVVHGRLVDPSCGVRANPQHPGCTLTAV